MALDPSGPDRSREPLALLAAVLRAQPDAAERVAFVRDLAQGDPDDPALDALGTWFERAHLD